MWRVWDDEFKPHFEGTEQEAKDYVVNHNLRSGSVYIQSPEGDELVYNWQTGEWVIETS
jgi:hypothetical protein